MPFDPFAWDWRRPFEQAAQQPRRSGLALEDLWSPSPRPKYPDAPNPYERYADLGDDAKKALRREAILRAAMALGGDPGKIGTNLAAAAQSVGDWKQEQLQAARQRQREDYSLASRQAEFDAEQQEYDRRDAAGKVKAQGALQAVQAVIDAEPEWGARAEAAARAGDFDSLDKMLGEAEKRRQIRASGGDPNDPFWDDRVKAEIAEKQKREHELWLKENDLGSVYFNKPVDLAEIEAKSAAAARGSRSVWGGRGDGAGGEGGIPRLLEHGDVPYQYTLGPEGFTGKPVPGAPAPAPNWVKIEDPKKRETFFYDPRSGQMKPAPPSLGRTFDEVENRLQKTAPGQTLTDEEKAVIEKQWRQGATPMLQGETVKFVEQNLGRRLSAQERNQVAAKWKQGVRAGAIVQQMKRPKPPAPGAPTQGNVRNPSPKPVRNQAALPPPLRREPVSDRDRQDLRAEVEARFASLSPEEREKKYQAALQLLEQGA